MLLTFLLLFTVTAEAQVRQVMGMETLDILEASCTGDPAGILDTLTPITGLASLTIDYDGLGLVGRCYVVGFDPDGTPNSDAFNLPDTYSRFKFRVNSLPVTKDMAFYGVIGVGNVFKNQFAITPAGTLAVYDSLDTLIQTGTTVLNVGSVYTIRIRSGTGTSGSDSPYELQINGVTELSGAMNQTDNNSGHIIVGFDAPIGGPPAEAWSFTVDDFIVTGSGFPPDGEILGMVPEADGAINEYVPDNLSDCYQEVLERPTDEAITTCSNTRGASVSGTFVQQWSLESPSSAGIPSSIQINGIKSYIIVKPSDFAAASSSQQASRLSINNVNLDNDFKGSPFAFFLWDFTWQVTDTNFDTSLPWTYNDLEDLETGLVLQLNGLQAVPITNFVSTSNISVDFTEVTPTPTPTPAPSTGKRILSLTGAGK